MKEEHLVGAASSVPQEVQKEVLKESVGGSVESDRLLVLDMWFTLLSEHIPGSGDLSFPDFRV